MCAAILSVRASVHVQAQWGAGDGNSVAEVVVLLKSKTKSMCAAILSVRALARASAVGKRC